MVLSGKHNKKDLTMKYNLIVTAIALTSLGANAWTLNNVRNISLARQACSETENVALKNCKLEVVNITPKAESEQSKLTLLLPPELR